MTRHEESQLLDFCVCQQAFFSADEWRAFRAVDRTTLATVALYLAGIDWFGYRPVLAGLANELVPGCVGDFAEMVKRTGFDTGRFAGLLKARLHHERAVS